MLGEEIDPPRSAKTRTHVCLTRASATSDLGRSANIVGMIDPDQER
jgi:hypothetical protein